MFMTDGKVHTEQYQSKGNNARNQNLRKSVESNNRRSTEY